MIALNEVMAHFADWLRASNLDPRKISLHILAEDMDTMARLNWLAKKEVSPYFLEPVQHHSLGFIRTIEGINVRIIDRQGLIRAMSSIKDAL